MLYREVNAKLVPFVRQHAPRSMVDDIIADTWEIVFRRWTAMPTDPSERHGWVFGVAKKVTARTVLHASRHMPSELVIEPVGNQGGDALSQYISGEAVRGVLAALSTAEREVLILYVLVGLSVKETAEELDCSISSVTTRLMRARHHAREYLKSETAIAVLSETREVRW